MTDNTDIPESSSARVRSPAWPVFLYRKRLELADVDKVQNRLLLTDTDRLMEFLTEEEMGQSNVDLTAVDGQGREYKMTLSDWEEKKKRVMFALDARGREHIITLYESCVFVLTKEWTRMVESNEVEADDYVDLWGFRRGSTDEICIEVVFSKA